MYVQAEIFDSESCEAATGSCPSWSDDEFRESIATRGLLNSPQRGVRYYLQQVRMLGQVPRTDEFRGSMPLAGGPPAQAIRPATIVWSIEEVFESIRSGERASRVGAVSSRANW